MRVNETEDRKSYPGRAQLLPSLRIEFARVRTEKVFASMHSVEHGHNDGAFLDEQWCFAVRTTAYG